MKLKLQNPTETDYNEKIKANKSAASVATINDTDKHRHKTN